MFFFSVYKDEPEDGEEASEERDVADDDIFSYRSTKSSSSELQSEKSSSFSMSSASSRPQENKPKPIGKIDLGAAASLVSVPKTVDNENNENGLNQRAPSNTSAPSAMNDLVDLMNTGPNDAPLIPANPTAETDIFSGFASATPSGNYFWLSFYRQFQFLVFL